MSPRRARFAGFPGRVGPQLLTSQYSGFIGILGYSHLRICDRPVLDESMVRDLASIDAREPGALEWEAEVVYNVI